MPITVEYKKISGIYMIKSLIDDRIYIGSAACLYTRCRHHKYLLNIKDHCNIKLQRFVNKYGIDSIDFEVMEVCRKDELAQIEQIYIDLLKPYFNICQFAQNSIGYKHTEESKRLMSLSKKGNKSSLGRVLSQETKDKIALKAKQRGLHPAFIMASNLAKIGKHHTKEHRRKVALNQMKFNIDTVKDIRYFLSVGYYQKDLAKMYGVSQRVICRINTKVGIYAEI